MTLFQIGWVLIALEVLLFLIWLFSILFPSSGTDAAGRGLGQAYTLVLGGYVLVGIVLMLFNNQWCTIVVIVMAAIPTAVVCYGLFRWLKNR